MKNETRNNQFGLFEFYCHRMGDGEDSKLDNMVIGLLSQAEEFAREYLEGVDDYLAHIDIYNNIMGCGEYIETIYKDLPEE